MTTPRELHVRVGSLRVVGGSTIEAGRVADALPEALRRALSGPPGPPTGPADLVAEAVAGRIRRETGAAGAEVGV